MTTPEPPRRRGRPPKSKAEKLAARRARETRQRAERREALGRSAPAVSPFQRGLAMLRAGTAFTEAPRDNAAEHQALVAFEHPALRYALTAEQTAAATALAEQMKTLEVTGYADNSLRSLASDWRHWQAFCLEHDRVVMPVAIEDLAAFLRALIEARYKRAALEHHLFTLRTFSRYFALPDPMATDIGRKLWRDLCRKQLSRVQKQAVGLTLETLVQLEHVVDSDSPRDLRDIAMASVLYDLLARASELVALRWDHVEDAGDEGAVLHIGRSKTDQEGIGHKAALRPETRDWLVAWRRHANADLPQLFHAVGDAAIRKRGEAPTLAPLTAKSITATLTRLAQRAGFDVSPFSGHSGRVGATQDMFDWGLSLPEIMQIGRWKTPVMPARYGAKRDALNAGKRRFAKAREEEMLPPLPDRARTRRNGKLPP
jgi:site-specific recombinase XerD